MPMYPESGDMLKTVYVEIALEIEGKSKTQDYLHHTFSVLMGVCVFLRRAYVRGDIRLYV